MDKRLAKLREAFSALFPEQKWDEERLRQLQEAIDAAGALEAPEQYGFTWYGKTEAARAADGAASGTLLPERAQSVRFDETAHRMLVGDNLDILKLLQEEMSGAVKMIYIDPPYNTGHDFIYCDNFRDPLHEYKQAVRMSTAGGGGKTESRTPMIHTDGRFHSRWLSYMYPRLKLAKDLLREDGAIFVSIGDHEAANLRKLLDELYGETNFVAQLVWANKEGGGGSDSSLFRRKHEYILVFAKQIDRLVLNGIAIENEGSYRYRDRHYEERGPYKIQALAQASIQYSKSLDYPITAPDGTQLYPGSDGKRACYRWSKAKLKWGIEHDFIEFRQDSSGNWKVYTKQYLKVDRNGEPSQRTQRPPGLIEKYSSTMGSKQLEQLFGEKVFDYSKPYLLISYLVGLVTNGLDGDIVLDFFAGSGTTAHAVLHLNAQDGGNRRYVLAQLPEPTGRGDYPTIADITIERIRRVTAQLQVERDHLEGQAEGAAAAAETASDSDGKQASAVARRRLTRRLEECRAHMERLSRLDLGFQVWRLDAQETAGAT